jgi:hypothetical protein
MVQPIRHREGLVWKRLDRKTLGFGGRRGRGVVRRAAACRVAALDRASSCGSRRRPSAWIRTRGLLHAEPARRRQQDRGGRGLGRRGARPASAPRLSASVAHGPAQDRRPRLGLDDSKLPVALGAGGRRRRRPVLCRSDRNRRDPERLEALVTAYCLARVAYQLKRYADRAERTVWKTQNVDVVLDALVSGT